MDNLLLDFFLQEHKRWKESGLKSRIAVPDYGRVTELVNFKTQKTSLHVFESCLTKNLSHANYISNEVIIRVELPKTRKRSCVSPLSEQKRRENEAMQR